MNTETELAAAELEADRLLRAFFRGEAPTALPPLHLHARPVRARSARRRYVALAASLALLGCLTFLGTMATVAKSNAVVSGPMKDVPPTAQGNGPKEPVAKPSSDHVKP
jgi:hypothetical protein